MPNDCASKQQDEILAKLFSPPKKIDEVDEVPKIVFPKLTKCPSRGNGKTKSKLKLGEKDLELQAHRHAQ